TSFSSPIMAGGVVCLWQALPDKTNAEIMQLVRESASQYSTPDYLLGYGIPDLQLALNSALSVDDHSRDHTINVFPNPVKDVVYFKLASNENIVDVNIFNILGKHLFHTFITPTSNQIDVSSLSKGMYLLRLESVNTSKTIKVMKH
ncbi:MAG TPA: S8 family peptidase, partial [Mariniflexile sp.]